MSLYHFCAPQFLEGIKKQGLVLGCTPLQIGGKLAFMEGTQWLTVNGAFEAQTWNGRVTVKYDRCAYRLEITIPEKYQDRLWSWSQMKGRLQIQHGLDCIIESFDDPTCSHSEDWRIFLGIVEPEWISEIIERPGGPNSDLVDRKTSIRRNRITP